MPAVPRWMWCAALGGLALVSAVVLAGALVLALGAANPPVEGLLQYDIVHPEEAAETTYLLPAVRALSVEVAGAVTSGSEDTAFGLWLQGCATPQRQIFALDGAGYVARFTPTEGPAGWVWFPHARPMPAANRLYIHIAAGKATFYINNEMVLFVPPEADEALTPVCLLGLYTNSSEHVYFERLHIWYNYD